MRLLKFALSPFHSKASHACQESFRTRNRPLSRGGLVLSTRLAVHKQSFLNLLRQNGRRVTKVCLQEDVK